MNNEILDLDDFLERVQDDSELLIELFDIFIADFQKKRIELEEAFKKRNFEAIEHIAHFLKGSCGNISAGSLHAIFRDLEQKGRDKTLGEDTGQYLNLIDEQFEKLVILIGEARHKLK